MALNDWMQDDVVGHKVDLLRFSEDVRGQVLDNLVSLGEDIQSQIQDADLAGIKRTAQKQSRQEALINQTADTIQTAYRDNDKILDTELLELADVSNNFSVNLINDGFQSKIATVALTRKDLEKLVSNVMVEGAPSKDWWDKQSADLQMRFAQQIRLGLMNGETNDQLVARIRGAYDGSKSVVTLPDGSTRTVKNFTGGIMDVSKRDATALVLTSVAAVSNDVLESTYRDNQDVLKGMLWISTLDFRTTAFCRSQDKGAWDFDGNPLPESRVKSKFPGRPPAHFRCRSVLSPITKSWDDLIAESGGKTKGPITDIPPTVRASMDGEVAGHLNYEDWLKTKSVAQQQQVLGMGKWKLWHDGKLTFQEMVDQQGNPLTLAQLKAKVDGDETVTTFADPSPPVVQPTLFDGDITGQVKAVEKQLKNWGVENATATDVVNATVPDANVFPEAVVSTTTDDVGPAIQINADAGKSTVERVIGTNADGKLVMDNNVFILDPELQGQGIGSNFFYSQVKNAQKLGVAEINTYAVRASGFNGYYTWARLGYDAPIPAQLLGKLPQFLKSATKISDLMMTTAGQSWWKKFGTSVMMTFDLTPGSLSLQILQAYMIDRAADQPQPEPDEETDAG